MQNSSLISNLKARGSYGITGSQSINPLQSLTLLGIQNANFNDALKAGLISGIMYPSEFENYVNPQSVVWLSPETKFWKEYLKNLLNEFHKDTSSKITEKILNNFESEISNFKQVCPKEMLDKLDNPITLRENKAISA